MAHIYKDSFFNYIDISSSRSAKNFIHDVTLPVQVNSILDIGCGRGAWIAEWNKNGKSVFGVDGDYVNVENLLVEKEFFKHQDISKSFNLNKKFDMVQCLEVAEHLQEADADTLIENIVKHGDIVLFSAAVPGQGGEFHVNEQPLSYWVKKFNHHDYVCLDCIRPLIAKNKNIESWYRYNTLLLVKSSIFEKLPSDIKSKVVTEIYDYNQGISLLWLLRNRILSILPNPFINVFAKLKHYMISLGR